jgi:signal transduction histidine kinase
MYGDAGTVPARTWTSVLAPASRSAARREAGSAATGRDGRSADAVSRRAGRGLCAVVGAGAAITLLVIVAPFVHFGYRSAETHVFIDGTASVIALLGAVLLAHRFRRSGLLGDLLLLAALAVLAAADLLLSVAPALVGTGPTALSTWALLTARLLATALFAAAAAAPSMRLRAPHRAAAVTLGACAAALVLLSGGALLLGEALPPAVTAAVPPASHPLVAGQPLLLAGQLAGMALFASAAVGFARAARTRDDEFLAWLAAAAVLGAFARLHYFLYPSLFTDVVYTGDVFILGFHVVLLAAAVREIRAYHLELADAAVLQERRRIARDLHDGLAQDLAFIASRVRVLERDPAARVRLDQLTSAAERALDDSRAAIAALTRPLDEPLDAALARNASEVAERLGGRADLDLEAGVDVPPSTRESLVRVVRESVTNAVRHGGARRVAVSLAHGEDLRLTIADDGCGFDPAARPARPDSGFGLLSMSERAEALGGALAIRSAPGWGTTIEVVLPCPPR